MIKNIFTFGLHELLLSAYEDGQYELICIHSVDMETFDLHGLILYVSEESFCNKLCIHSAYLFLHKGCFEKNATKAFNSNFS